MKSKQLLGTEQKTYALIFDSGDDVMAGLTSFARDNGDQAVCFRSSE